MKACPLEIGHPSQAAQLKYIGPVLCARLEKSLLAHCKETGMQMPERPSNKRPGEENADSESATVVRKKRPTKAYVPTYRSGPYALLLGLTESGCRDNAPKSDVIRLAQPFCDTSFQVASDSRGYYTAWTSMKTLIDKELVHKAGNPPKYTITDSGAEVANRLRATADPESLLRQQSHGVVDVTGVSQLSDSAETQEDLSPAPDADIAEARDVTAQFEPIFVPRGTFTIQLIFDNREVKSQRDRAFIEEQLFQSGISLQARTLDVGDAMWIAKCQDGREVVLDHIVERKRMDDLVHSIKDGRFHEQKFRLQRCGARQIIFVIEETNLQDVISYQEAIQTALSSTQVVNGFFVKRVQSLDYTIRYLVRLTKRLSALYEVRDSMLVTIDSNTLQAQDLTVLPDYMVDTRTFQDLRAHLQTQQPSTKYYLTYQAFAGLTAKSAHLQVILLQLAKITSQLIRPGW